MSFSVPEFLRIRIGQLASDSTYGNNGAFAFSCEGKGFLCIASDGMGWEHVSVSIAGSKKPPTWDEMCMVKNLFWGPDDCVMQFHPPSSQYVNNHPGCLHLWRMSGVNAELPPSILVGVI